MATPLIAALWAYSIAARELGKGPRVPLGLSQHRYFESGCGDNAASG
jgi:hypothetical protein